MEYYSQLVKSIVKKLYSLDVDVLLDRPKSEFGDYSTNIAMVLAGKLQQKPRDIADKLVSELITDNNISQAEVAGPGFVNFSLNEAAILELVKLKPTTGRVNQTVVIETNNPNPFKAIHIGHAYNAVLADTLANLLAVSGAKVHRVSYHGDVGTHVGKSMWAILKYCDGDVTKLKQIKTNERNQFMSQMYIEGSSAYKDNESVKVEVKKLAEQSFKLDDEYYKSIYKTCAKWSFNEIDKTMERLSNVPIEKRYLESQTESPGKDLIIKNTPKVFTKSEGAYIFKGSKYGAFDNVYIASNGNGLYGAHDIGLINLKYQDYPNLNMSVVVTGNEQSAYFKGVISASELSLPNLKGKLFNYPTGLVKLSTGKMSSRTGEVVEIDWLFKEFSKAIKTRGGEPTDEIIAGALRYQLLKVKIGSDVVFDVNESVSLTGNTGSYLQYAHARARRILEKSTKSYTYPTKINAEDKTLMRKLSEYSEVISRAGNLLEPHLICTYLYDLAQEFNRYYEKNQVIGSSYEEHRLAIVAIYADILNAGLLTLGIKAPNSM